MDADCQYGCTAASEEGWPTRRAKPLSFMRARLAHGAGHWMLEAETLGDRLHSAQLAPLDGDLPNDDWRASPRHHGDHGPQLAVDDDELPAHHGRDAGRRGGQAGIYLFISSGRLAARVSQSYS